MLSDQKVKSPAEHAERRHVGNAKLQFRPLRSVRSHGQQRPSCREERGPWMPGELERIVTPDAVGKVIGDEHREFGWDDEFIEAAARLRSTEQSLSAIDRGGECAVRKRVVSDYSLMYQDEINSAPR